MGRRFWERGWDVYVHGLVIESSSERNRAIYSF